MTIGIRKRVTPDKRKRVRTMESQRNNGVGGINYVRNSASATLWATRQITFVYRSRTVFPLRSRYNIIHFGYRWYINNCSAAISHMRASQSTFSRTSQYIARSDDSGNDYICRVALMSMMEVQCYEQQAARLMCIDCRKRRISIITTNKNNDVVKYFSATQFCFQHVSNIILKQIPNIKFY